MENQDNIVFDYDKDMTSYLPYEQGFKGKSQRDKLSYCYDKSAVLNCYILFDEDDCELSPQENYALVVEKRLNEILERKNEKFNAMIDELLECLDVEIENKTALTNIGKALSRVSKYNLESYDKVSRVLQNLSNVE